ncbi:acyltransferase [Mesorhizobium tamadayense]|uniref:Acyltransferase n=1 Tax=Mesorhizobium tamadayense TaxID=425306 RepID=A0A3P3FK81_9HYPH|nr:acyltransferase [Mesorhizobium tamadayense]RRH98098.1 acyltransferase [Mesorhizobium tamadayense]
MKHNPSLDGIRALAALVVMAFHSKLPFALGGFIGVDIFFVLSGFLITSLLKREADLTGRISFTQFYIRRALRLWPPLLLLLAGYLVVAPLVFPPVDFWRQVVLAGLYLSDYAKAFWGDPVALTHTWSLSVEEHFYMLWPVVILLVSRRCSGDRQLALIFLGLFVAASLWRMTDLVIWQDWQRTFFRFDTRMSGLLLGAAIAYLPWRPSGRQADAIGIVSACGLAAAILVLRFRSPWPLLHGGTLVDLCAAGLVLAAVQERSRVAAVLGCKPLAALGLISYSIYLWSVPIAVIFRTRFDAYTSFAATAVISIAIAAASWWLIERPLKAYRLRMVPKAVAATA